jgi:hypothetical protein
LTPLSTDLSTAHLATSPLFTTEESTIGGAILVEKAADDPVLPSIATLANGAAGGHADAILVFRAAPPAVAAAVATTLTVDFIAVAA